MLDSRLIRQLRRAVGKEHVLTSRLERELYSYDSSIERGLPEAVIFPGSPREVARVISLAQRAGIAFVARGAGTNLSGGSVPARGGLVLSLTRMNRIVEIDLPNLRAVVEPGVINLDLQRALEPLGYCYAPDPASQKVSTLGGNVGENSGGPHCLKYGVTTDHVLGLQVAMPDGRLLELGGKASESPGYDLVGVLVGSEGTLGVVTGVTVRIRRLPMAGRTLLAIFDSLQAAGQAVSQVIAEGIIPAALELMDRLTLRAVEESTGAGYPLDAEAVLIIELDGRPEGMDRLAEQCCQICRAQGVRQIKSASDPAEREQLWSGRRGALGAIARISPNFLVNDATVPRARLPEVLARTVEISARYRLPVANLLHAGDGNLHPNVLFDDRDPDQRRRARAAAMEIMRACVEVGGTLSGEHGVGLEKIEGMPLVFSPASLRAMGRVKRCFDPNSLCNPQKVLPEEATVA